MDFSALNKNASKSFHQQKNLIKKVFAGKDVLCPVCSKKLSLKTEDTGLLLSCGNSCTDISLDAELLK